MALQTNLRPSAERVLNLVGLAVSFVALLMAFFSFARVRERPPAAASASAIERIARTGVLRVAYGGFPPYTIVDPSEPDPSKRVSGFTVDLIDEIARRSSPKLIVEWHNMDWDTFRADLLSDKFDVVADAVYATVPKAQDFAFTEPFSYFGLDAAVVRINDDRFVNFHDLDHADITIALAEGYVSNDYAKAELAKPRFKMVSVGKDAFSQMDEVLLGRADVALNDVPTVVQYVRAHTGKVKALWVDNPPSWAAASFVTRRSDTELNAMLSTDMRILQVDGTLERLDRKWKSLGFFKKLDLRPGAGLQPTAR